VSEKLIIDVEQIFSFPFSTMPSTDPFADNAPSGSDSVPVGASVMPQYEICASYNCFNVDFDLSPHYATDPTINDSVPMVPKHDFVSVL
jgi:hypothetical protein